MLTDFHEMLEKHNVKITGVIHAGAHLVEEAPLYHSLGVPVLWIEAYPPLIRKIQEKLSFYPDQRIVNALLTNVDGDMRKFNVTNYDSMSSSVFEFGTHPTFSPDTVFIDQIELQTITLDTLVKKNNVTGMNFLNMDLQGAELLALYGARELLPQIDYIYCEVNKADVYIGCAKVHQIDAYLTGFKRVETWWTRNGWGDALYVRSSEI